MRPQPSSRGARRTKCGSARLAHTALHHPQKMTHPKLQYLDNHLSDRHTFLGKNEQPDVGLEPTTLRLRVSRATDCASRAYCCLMKISELTTTIHPFLFGISSSFVSNISVAVVGLLSGLPFEKLLHLSRSRPAGKLSDKLNTSKLTLRGASAGIHQSAGPAAQCLALTTKMLHRVRAAGICQICNFCTPGAVSW